MKFDMDISELFSSEKMQRQNRSLDKRKAVKIIKQIIEEHSNLPLMWDNLEKVILSGVIDESVEMELHFCQCNSPVLITNIYVEDDGRVLQSGSNYGNLIY